MPIRTLEMPLQTRSAPVTTIDAEKRTVDVVYTTGAAVRRRRWTGWDTSVPFDEVLEVSERAINAERLNSGAPVLDSHETYSSRSHLAVVERSWIADGQGFATLRFPSAGIDEAADRMFGMVSEGIVRNVSVGYSIDKVRVVEATAKDVEKRIVERWTPYEISFVTVNADASAQVRSADGGDDDAPLYPVVVESPETRSEEPPMTVETTPAAPVDETATRSAADAAVKAERARIFELTQIGQRHSLPAEFVQRHIADGTGLDAYRSAVLDELSAADPARAVRSSVSVVHPGQSPIEVRAAMAHGLVARATGALPKEGTGFDANQIRAYADMSLMELGGELLGIKGRMRPVRLFEELQSRSMNGSTDFPNLLQLAANKILLAQYQYQEPSYRKLARKRNFNDFKAHSFLRVGDFPILEALTETGEFRNGSLSENKETVTAATYGKIVSFSRQMMVNDDLSAFSDITGAAGRRVADFENSLAWALILSNSKAGPALSDTGNLFNATAVTTAGGHANQAGTATAVTVAALSAGRLAMRQQKSLDGIPLNVNPTVLVAGPAKQTEVEQLLSTSLLATQISNINPFNGGGLVNLAPVIDAYINDNAWYLFADPVSVPTFTWGYVDGFEGPRFAIDQPFRQDGIQFKVVEDFGFGAIDFRGAYRNPGA